MITSVPVLFKSPVHSFMSFLTICIFAMAVNADEKAVRTRFESGIWNYQTSLVRFEKDDLEVTFVAAVHIAPKSFYEKLNRHFKSYDAVLYEKVKGLQEALKDAGVESSPWDLIAGKLQMDSQLKSIDYDAKNFVHADMSLNELQKLDAVKKEDVLNPQQMKLLNEEFKKAPAPALMSFYRNIFSREDLKNPLIIGARNERCMEVLKEQIKKHKKIAVFFGAAHFKDMKARLEKLGFKQAKLTWVTVYMEK